MHQLFVWHVEHRAPFHLFLKNQPSQSPQSLQQKACLFSGPRNSVEFLAPCDDNRTILNKRFLFFVALAKLSGGGKLRGMGRSQFIHGYNHIISKENLLEAWQEFLKGKRGRKDVQNFEFDLMANIFFLYNDLKNRTYKHFSYYAFNISDPKPRHIHKASVRDRLLHHALYRKLYPFFDKTFISDSYSCRINKGTHKAINRYRSFSYKAAQNNTRPCWVLKGDIKKFFASVDHKILLNIIDYYIINKDIKRLLDQIIISFDAGIKGKGLPLGNLTSQLFVNIYMNEFDQFMKHKIKAKYYIRYADDFVILSENKQWLENIIFDIKEFLLENLDLSLHEDKTYIKTLASGIDFLGWVHFPDHRVLRKATKRKMLARISENQNQETVASYLGLLKHGNAEKLISRIR